MSYGLQMFIVMSCKVFERAMDRRYIYSMFNSQIVIEWDYYLSVCLAGNLCNSQKRLEFKHPIVSMEFFF